MTDLHVLQLNAAAHYADPLRRAVVRLGVDYRRVDNTQVTPEWLASTYRPGSLLHVHFPHYAFTAPSRAETAARLATWTTNLRLARQLGYGIVWTAHNLLPHENRHPDLQVAARRALAGSVTGLIAHCRAAAAEIERRFRPAVACRVISHGGFQESYTPVPRAEARRELDLAEDVVVFLHFGELRAYKGTADLITEFRRLPDPNARLLIAGRASAGHDDQVMVALAGGDRRIRFGPSPVPDREVARLFAAADVVVLPYRSVLTSGNVLLARSLGRPVVAPAIGCIPETVAPGGAILYDAASVDGLGTALAAAMRSDLRAMAAAVEASPPADWSTIADQTVDTYRSAVERARD